MSLEDAEVLMATAHRTSIAGQTTCAPYTVSTWVVIHVLLGRANWLYVCVCVCVCIASRLSCCLFCCYAR